MAINVWGTQGTVNEVQWAKLAEGFGQKYTLVSGNAVTSSGRNLSIPPRVSIGCGVAVENTTAEAKAVPVPAAGQWFLLVLRRQWGANRGATFELINGSTTTDAVPTAPPTTLPALRNKAPGLIDDEPVAWVHARASVTTLTIWQMQTRRDGRIPGIWAMYDANEQGMYTVFSEADNTEYVWMSPNWVPTFGGAVAFDMMLSASLARSGTATWAKMPFNLAVTNQGDAFNTTLNRFVAPRKGTYEFFLNMVMSVNSGGPTTQFYVNGVSPSSGRASLHYTSAYIGSPATEILNLEKGDYVEAWLQNANGQSFTVSNLHGTRFTGKLL